MHAYIYIIIVVYNTTYTYIATVVQHWTIKVINTFRYCCIDGLPASCADGQRIVQ